MRRSFKRILLISFQTFFLLGCGGGSSGSSTTTPTSPVTTNSPPIANAGDDQTVYDLNKVTLDGSNSSDTDGSISKFTWKQISGISVVLNDSSTVSPTFTAPNVGAEEILTFELQVTDNANGVATDRVDITIQDANTPPVVDIEQEFVVNEQTLLTLTPTVNDEDLDSLEYNWIQLSGSTADINNPNDKELTINIPATNIDTSLVFKLTVTDNEGLATDVSVSVQVNDVAFTLESHSSEAIDPANNTQQLSLNFNEELGADISSVEVFENDELINFEIVANGIALNIKPHGGFKYSSDYRIALSELTSFSNSDFQGSDLAFTTKARDEKMFVGAVVTDGVLNAMNVNDSAWTPESLFTILNENGINNFRLGNRIGITPELDEAPLDEWDDILSNNDLPNSWSSRELARYTITKGGKDGNNHSVFLFLSDAATHASTYYPGDDWAALTFEQRLEAIELHSAEVAQYFLDFGVNVSQFEIGNEVDFGIAGIQIGDELVGEDIDVNLNDNSAQEKLWPYHVAVFNAAIKGIHSVNPTAKIGLHLAGMAYSEQNIYSIGFFKHMINENVDFDVIGLSYPYLIFEYNEGISFPYFKNDDFKFLINSLAELNKKIQISEFSYFTDSTNIKVAVEQRYSNTEEGQANFMQDFLSELNRYPAIEGVYYFYADYYDEMEGPDELSGIGLFRNQSTPKPALSSSIKNFVEN